MKKIYDLALALHIGFGFVCLVAFWGAALAKKGGRIHLRVGRVFVYSMYTVCITSVITAVITISDPLQLHPEKDPAESVQFAVFLLFLGILTFSTTWNGVRFIKEKKDLLALWHPLDLGINALTLLAGAAVLGIGVVHKNPLLTVFGFLGGILSSISHFKFLAQLKKQRPAPRTYLRQHMESMVGAGVALHTAFLAGGAATRYFPWLGEKTGILLWFFPSVVGGVVQYRLLNSSEVNPRIKIPRKRDGSNKTEPDL